MSRELADPEGSAEAEARRVALCSAVAPFDHDVHLRGASTGNGVALPA